MISHDKTSGFRRISRNSPITCHTVPSIATNQAAMSQARSYQPSKYQTTRYEVQKPHLPGDMCKQLEVETEVASWTENGGLFVGTNAERLAEYRRFAETGKYFGIESHVLSPAEVKEAPVWEVGGYTQEEVWGVRLLKMKSLLTS